MKRRIAILIMIFILLLGCVGCAGGTDDQNYNTQPSTEQTGLNTAIDLPAELNAQNKYTHDGFFQETEDYFCGKGFTENYIRYYDKTTGIGGVLCADPTCTHDSSECGAYASESSVLCYDGKLYRITSKNPSAFDWNNVLVESDLSGMNRRTVMEISWDDIILTYMPQRYEIHQGKLYLIGRAQAASGTEVGYRVSLLSRPLDSDEPFTVLYDESFSGGVQETVRFIGNYIYLSVFTYKDEQKDLTITRFDIQSGEVETVYQEFGIMEAVRAIWVTDDHEIYLPGYTEETAYLWKLENNERIEIKFWDTDAWPYVTEDVVVVITRENDIRYAEICDFSGNLIYSGKLFPDPIDGVDFDPNTCGFRFLGGDAEKLIVQLVDLSGKTNLEHTVLLDLKNNLEATLLWSNAK